MVPDIFRDLDRVAAQELSFLVDQKGAKAPTVEFWRDYFLVYSLAEDLQFRVGMERGCLVPFLFIHSHGEQLVSFYFPKLLGFLGHSLYSREAESCAKLAELFSVEEYRKLEGVLSSEWPVYLNKCARVLDENFDAVVGLVRSASQGSLAEEIGVVLQPGVPTLGAGSYFAHKRILPIEREDFWRLADRGFSPSYAPVTCPSCSGTGNVGVRELRPASFLGWFRKKPVELFCLQCDQVSSIKSV